MLLPGLVLIAVGLLGFARAPVDGSYLTDVLPVMIPLGIGAGLFFPALTTLAMSGVTPSESGLASGLVNTSLQVGGSIGLAILATLSASRSENLLADGESTASALTSGYHLAFVIAAGAGDRGNRRDPDGAARHRTERRSRRKPRARWTSRSGWRRRRKPAGGARGPPPSHSGAVGRLWWRRVSVSRARDA